jgi:phage shock protein A
MLNWRRDPGYEQRKIRHEVRMKQLESEIEQIRTETEQLRLENAKQSALSALIRQHCFSDESNSTPIPPTEPDSGSS